jgi:hypothetical protein
MLRLLLVLAIIFAACGDDSSRLVVDAPIHDAPTDGAGSGSDAMTMIEPHPHDSKLDILVAGLSVGVIIGPAFGARRRKRRDAI